jgi:hypothetical protein
MVHCLPYSMINCQRHKIDGNHKSKEINKKDHQFKLINPMNNTQLDNNMCTVVLLWMDVMHCMHTMWGWGMNELVEQ